MRTLLLTSAIISASLATTTVFADVNDRLNELEREIEKIRQQTGAQDSGSRLDFSGSFRPVLTYADDGKDTSMDVRDALSRFGFSGSTPVMDNAKVYFAGEWNVKIADAGQIDGARTAYVGISGSYGDLSIGKQRPPQYNLIGGHVDIFNHGLSPYAYDSTGAAGFNPFFIDNSTVYKFSANNLQIQAATRTDGTDGEDNSDFINAGLSYSAGQFYVAYAYTDASGKDGANSALVGDKMKNNSVAAYMDMAGFYLAAAYQDITYTPQGGKDVDRSSVDVSAAYPLANDYKVKAGYFDYDDGNSTNTSKSFSGFNLTLERQLADNVRVHAEYLSKDMEKGDTAGEFTVGIRYDFSARLK